jgi:hypothetical protein
MFFLMFAFSHILCFVQRGVSEGEIAVTGLAFGLNETPSSAWYGSLSLEVKG